MSTYFVQTYDVADDPSRDGDWTTVAERVPLWRLRPIIRELRARGYDDDVSIYVARESS